MNDHNIFTSVTSSGDMFIMFVKNTIIQPNTIDNTSAITMFTINTDVKVFVCFFFF